MARFSALFGLTMVAAIATSPALGNGPFGSIHVGNWKGGAYTNDQTGAFSHCAAGTGYANGVTVILGQNADGAWLLGFAKQTFGLTPGETFQIEVTFDGQAQFHLFGTAANAKFVSAILPNNTVIDQFRKAHLMVATEKGATYQFSLASTGQLLPTLANCVAKTKATGVANASDFSIPVQKPAVTKPVVEATPASPAAPKQTKLVALNGTGFVISMSSHIVTNNHVVADCVGDIQGNLSGEPSAVLRLVSADETNDLALLQVAKPFEDAAVIRLAPIHPGDAIIAIGYPYRGLLQHVPTGVNRDSQGAPQERV
jgi:S1-C subfamily serine protease